MKTRTMILLFFLVLSLGCSVETKKEFYPDGKVKAEMRYKKESWKVSVKDSMKAGS